MATTTKKKEKEISRQEIISAYMDHVLTEGHQPPTIYKFCKDASLTEAGFYKHFGSFKGLKEQIWVAFFEHTMIVLNKDKAYETYPNKEKMLSFLFTFFEMLTANRSYILFTLHEHKNMLQKMEQLKELRVHVKKFASGLIETGNDEKNYRITKNPVGIFSEGAWLQTLFLLKYWMDDNSPAFEKTDVAIEKSVAAIFDIFDSTPLESIIDFGKFLIKDQFASAKA
jgi:AcrR family transcriptional regulator